MLVSDLGLMKYNDCRALQLQLRDRLMQSGKSEDEKLLLVEHYPVYTLGRHGKADNMLVSDERLRAMGTDCIRIERGGDITFHGPGQLVVYPIINLRNHHLGVKQYIHLLEQSVIDTIANYGIPGERVEGATGVWIEPGTPMARKICAIGVSVSHFCTMHGLALNVNTDLTYFNAINPCGFSSNSVTSISKETKKAIDMAAVKRCFVNSLKL